LFGIVVWLPLLPFLLLCLVVRYPYVDYAVGLLQDIPGRLIVHLPSLRVPLDHCAHPTYTGVVGSLVGLRLVVGYGLRVLRSHYRLVPFTVTGPGPVTLPFPFCLPSPFWLSV
jgi:hypothetical protein